MTACRSCGATIVWAATSTGERIPLDPHPAVDGNIRTHTDRHGLRARVVGGTIDLFDPTDDGIRYISHFVTCPHADQWRTP